MRSGCREVRLSTGRLAVAAAASLVALAGCGRPTSEYLLDWEHGIGYASAGVVPFSRFPGDSKGVERGSGWSVTVPPLFPASVTAFCCLIYAEAEGGGSGDATMQLAPYIFAPGVVSGVSDQNRYVVSEVSAEATFSESWHEDADFGGKVDYESWLFGLRIGGPERYCPSYSFSGGWGWHKFEFDSRPDARAQGPYLGAALQLFVSREFRLLVELRRHFFVSETGGDAPSDGAWQGVVGVTAAWHF